MKKNPPKYLLRLIKVQSSKSLLVRINSYESSRLILSPLTQSFILEIKGVLVIDDLMSFQKHHEHLVRSKDK